MDYCDFERFVVGVLTQYYARANIQILGGKCRRDGGRDGEGELVVGDAVIASELQGRFRIWLEAKHWVRSVNPNATLGHIAAAFVAGVSKVVFVSSGRFSAGARQSAEMFSRKTGLDCTFLDGERLLEVAASMGLPVQAPSAPIKDKGQPRQFTQSTTVDGASDLSGSVDLAVPGLIRLQGEFAYSQWQLIGNDARAKDLTLSPGDPVFLSVTADIGLISHLRQVEFALLLPKGWDANLLAARKSLRLAAGDRVHFLFALFPSEERETCIHDFAVELTEQGGKPIVLGVEGDQKCKIVARPLKFLLSPEQSDAERLALDSVEAWQDNLRARGILIQAAQGRGKSFLLRHLRRTWLKRGHLEILLDCEVCQSPEEMLQFLFAKLFPVEADELSITNQGMVADWFETAGLDSSAAKRIAEALCTTGRLPETVGAKLLADIVVTLLAHVTGQRPTILVIDDLHKASGSFLALVRDVVNELARRKAPLLLILTSRFTSSHSDQDDLSYWADEMSLLCREGKIDVISFAGDNELWATTILSSTFPELSAEDCRAVTDQVGTTPFCLTEAVRCLMGPQEQARKPAIAFEAELGRLAVIDLPSLYDRITDGSLRAATVTRVKNILRVLPDWACTFLQGAAVQGRQFSYSHARAMIQKTDRDIDAGLGVLEREDICTGSAFSDSGDLRFSHDLVRRAVLEIFSAPEALAGLRRVASCLLTESWSPDRAARLKPLLAYASGSLATFLESVDVYALDAKTKGRPGDAVPMLLRAVECIDPTRLPSLFLYGREPRALDDVLAVVPRPAEGPGGAYKAQRERRLLTLLSAIADHASAVTSGSAEIVERAVNEGLIIAEVLGDRASRVRLLSKIARMWIERGAPDKSLAMHRLADAEMDTLSEPLPESEKAEMLISYAIALRLMGSAAESDEKLEQAFALAGEGEPRIARQVLSNRGALFFYTDAAKRREYWIEALAVATKAGDRHGAVHCGLDLASIDFLENRFADAADRVRKAVLDSEENGYDNLLIRASVMMGALLLVDNKADAALRHLRRAESLAVLHSVDRRLWKSRANMATAYEMLQRWDLSYLEDSRALERVPDLAIALAHPEQVTRERRVTVLLGNIALRARVSESHGKLLANLRPEMRNVADSLADCADAVAAGKYSGFPFEHCKRCGNLIRYVIV